MAAFPNAFFTDSVGSSETGFQGTGLQDQDNIKGEGCVVTLGPESVVLDEDNRVIDAGDVGAVGRLARSGSVPLGYYKDAEKSARTFVEVDGTRYSIPGDFARIEPDNKVTLLGRGSNCINTGGEKVYPEEVEEVLKQHPSVFDAAVVGVPDDRFGETIAALVQPSSGVSLSADELIDHVKAHLAGYKAPRRVITVESVNRAPNGKLDYKSLKQIALETSS